MKKTKNIKPVLLIIYLVIIIGLFSGLIFPAIAKPKGLRQSEVPTLFSSGLQEVNQVFLNFGKEYLEIPREPDVSNYIFGGKDPL